MSNSNSSSESAVQDAVTAVLQHNFDAVSKPCLLTILKLLDNLIQKPYESKFRTVKLSNAAIQTKIGTCKGGVEVLQACGFAYDNASSNLVLPEHSPPQQDLLVLVRRKMAQRIVHELGCAPEELPQYKAPPPPVHLVNSSNSNNNNTVNAAATNANATNTFNPYQGQRFDGLSASVGANLGPDSSQWKSKTEAELERLQRQQKQLEAKLHHVNTISRDWMAARPGDALPVAMAAAASSNNNSTTTTASQQQQPQPSDGALLAQRAQRLQAERLQREQGGFTTHAMRQVERLKKQKVYSHCTLQIQFPDGSKCCGKFLPSETVSAVQAALRSDCLEDAVTNTDFDLYVAPPRRLLPPSSQLQTEGLVPAAKLFVSWKVAPAPTDCLKPALFHQQHNNSRQQQASVAFPQAHPIAATTTTTQSSNKAGTADGGEPAKKKKTGNSREEDLLKRMMGGGLGGGGGGGSKKSSGDKKDNGNNKPKWFKG